jgi:hypothetical protein
LDDSSRLTPHANKSGRRSEDDGEEEKIGKKRKKRRLGSADVVAATILRAFRPTTASSAFEDLLRRGFGADSSYS